MGCGNSKEQVAATVTQVEEYDAMLKAALENKHGGGVASPEKDKHDPQVHTFNLKPVSTADVTTATPATAVRLESGAKYKGEWHNGEKHGKGTLLWANGSYLDANWVDGNASGKGIYHVVLPGSKFIQYEGEFLDNKLNGNVVVTFADGSRHEGPMVEDIRVGEWNERFADGGSFVGAYEGERSGRGVYSFADGCVFDGMFENGDMKGWGRHQWPDGRVYKGQWADGQMHGVGVFAWPGGRQYVGHYDAGRKHGYGIFKWPEGKEYRGYWSGGSQHGFAEFKHPNGNTRNGIYNQGLREKWIKPSEVKAECAELGVSTTLNVESDIIVDMPEWLINLPGVADGKQDNDDADAAKHNDSSDDLED